MPDFLEALPLLIPILIFMIPIIAILASHQQKMAQIVNNRQQTPSAEIDMLRMEIRELKQLVQQQALMLDDVRTQALKANSKASSGETEIRDRLVGG